MTAIATIFDCEQGSTTWRAARCGLVTASRCADVLAMIKSGEAAARRNYKAQLIAEILTGIPGEQYVSKEMEWGIQQEPFARAAYEMQSDVMVDTTGFVTHASLNRFGASPDGLVGEDGMIQIKCPNTSTHIAWMLAGTVPIEHAPQMLAEMACTGRSWSDFVSFDPRLPKHLQLFIRRFERNEEHIVALEAAVAKFNTEIDEVLARLPQPPRGQGQAQPIVELLDHVDPSEWIV